MPAQPAPQCRDSPKSSGGSTSPSIPIGSVRFLLLSFGLCIALMLGCGELPQYEEESEPANLSCPFVSRITPQEVGLSPESFTEIICENKKLTSLPYLEQYVNLLRLNLSNNYLETIDLSQQTQLRHLNLSNNYLETIDLSQQAQLTNLDVSNNQLETIDLKALTALRVLDVSDNQLKTIDLKTLTALRSLSAANNQLTQIDLRSQQTELMRLDLENNTLNNIGDLSRFTKLKVLRLKGTNLSCSNLGKPPNFNPPTPADTGCTP